MTDPRYIVVKDVKATHLAFELDICELGAAPVKNKVNQLLQLMQLEKLSGQYLNQLSSGQRNRLALLAIELNTRRNTSNQGETAEVIDKIADVVQGI